MHYSGKPNSLCVIHVISLTKFFYTQSGIPRSTLTYVLASIFASLATVLLLVGAALWSALIHQIRGINAINVHIIFTRCFLELMSYAQVISGAPLGVSVTFGSALWLLWAAFIILFLSLLPYVVRYPCFFLLPFLRVDTLSVVIRIEHVSHDLRRFTSRKNSYLYRMCTPFLCI